MVYKHHVPPPLIWPIPGPLRAGKRPMREEGGADLRTPERCCPRRSPRPWGPSTGGCTTTGRAAWPPGAAARSLERADRQAADQNGFSVARKFFSSSSGENNFLRAIKIHFVPPPLWAPGGRCSNCRPGDTGTSRQPLMVLRMAIHWIPFWTSFQGANPFYNFAHFEDR